MESLTLVQMIIFSEVIYSVGVAETLHAMLDFSFTTRWPSKVTF